MPLCHTITTVIKKNRGSEIPLQLEIAEIKPIINETKEYDRKFTEEPVKKMNPRSKEYSPKENSRKIDQKKNDLYKTVERKYDEIMKLLKIVANIKTDITTDASARKNLKNSEYRKYMQKGDEFSKEKNTLKAEKDIKQKMMEIMIKEELLKDLGQTPKKLRGENSEDKTEASGEPVGMEDEKLGVRQQIDVVNSGKNYKKKEQLNNMIKELKSSAAQKEVEKAMEDIKNEVKVQDSKKNTSILRNQDLEKGKLRSSPKDNNSERDIKKSAEEKKSEMGNTADIEKEHLKFEIDFSKSSIYISGSEKTQGNTNNFMEQQKKHDTETKNKEDGNTDKYKETTLTTQQAENKQQNIQRSRTKKKREKGTDMDLFQKYIMEKDDSSLETKSMSGQTKLLEMESRESDEDKDTEELVFDFKGTYRASVNQSTINP